MFVTTFVNGKHCGTIGLGCWDRAGWEYLCVPGSRTLAELQVAA